VIFQTPVPTDDSLRAVVDTVLSAAPYQWTETTPRLSWITRWWYALLDWVARLQENNPTAAELLFWSLVVVLVAILVHGGWIMYQTLRGGSAREGPAGTVRSVEIQDDRFYQRLADTLAEQGRFAEAMQAAFTSLVLRLDAKGVLRYHPSKTPREYAGEARLDESSRGRLRDSVARLYACAYAGAPCGPSQYQDWMLNLRHEWHAAPG
jgi:hypothetical protein